MIPCCRASCCRVLGAANQPRPSSPAGTSSGPSSHASSGACSTPDRSPVSACGSTSARMPESGGGRSQAGTRRPASRERGSRRHRRRTARRGLGGRDTVARLDDRSPDRASRMDRSRGTSRDHRSVHVSGRTAACARRRWTPTSTRPPPRWPNNPRHSCSLQWREGRARLDRGTAVVCARPRRSPGSGRPCRRHRWRRRG